MKILTTFLKTKTTKTMLDFLKEPQREFLKEGNYHLGQTVEGRYMEIFQRLDFYSDFYGKEVVDRIKDLVSRNVISLSTPTIANFGKLQSNGALSKSLSASCNILTITDSIYDIYSSNLELAMLSKRGAGVGVDFTRIADKGTSSKEGFYVNSKLDWINALIDTSQKVSQNGVRRGYATPFISIEDSEFFELLKAVDRNNSDASSVLVDNTVGIKIPYGFMSKLETGDKEARRRWLKCIDVRRMTGQLYLVFEENMNKNCSPIYEDLGHKINNTNICCVTGDQMVATVNGFKTVKQLSDEGGALKLFDNEGTYNSTAMLLRGNTDVFRLTLDNGITHTITSNHEVVVKEGRKNIRKSLDTGLEVGDKVCFQTNKGLFGSRDERELAFLLGLFLGDGSTAGYSTIIPLWEHDFDLLDEVQDTAQLFYNKRATNKHHSNKLPEFIDGSTGDSEVKKKTLNTSIFNRNGFEFKKFEIPDWIWDANEKTHYQLLRGLLYTDGTVGDYNKGKSFGKPISVSLTSINLEFLRKVQLIGLNLGLNFKIYPHSKAGLRMLPKNDGSGESKPYNCKDSWRLVLSNKNDLLKLEKETGFLSRKGVEIEYRHYRNNSHKSSKIISIEPLPTKEDVYCPTVDSEKHLWICNGVITSNTEYIQPHVEGHTPVCVIAALNLIHWDEIKSNPQIIEDAIYMLDIINEEYVNLSLGQKGIEKARQSALERRDIGLGTLGFHSLLQSKGMAFGDLQSRLLNREIYSLMQRRSIAATERLAFELGACPFAKKANYDRRNCSLMMIAPNKSTSFLCTLPGSDSPVSAGIEPYFSNVFTKKLAKIQYTFKNPFLKKVLEGYGRDDFDTWESISNNLGSVQHLDFLTAQEKDVFKTFAEIAPKDIIDLAADRQQYIDMGQSLNLVNRPNYTMKDLHKMHKYAYDKGIKTLYYFYPQAHAVLEKSDGGNWDDCVSCAD